MGLSLPFQVCDGRLASWVGNRTSSLKCSDSKHSCEAHWLCPSSLSRGGPCCSPELPKLLCATAAGLFLGIIFSEPGKGPHPNWRITVSCCICIVQEYKERRDFVCNMLVQAGFSNFLKPQGSFFVFAQLPDKCPLNDVSKHSDPSILGSVSWRAAVSPKMWILCIWGWRAAVLWVHSFSKCFLQKFYYSLMGFWAPIKQHRTGETATEMVPRFGHQNFCLLWVC